MGKLSGKAKQSLVGSVFRKQKKSVVAFVSGRWIFVGSILFTDFFAGSKHWVRFSINQYFGLYPSSNKQTIIIKAKITIFFYYHYISNIILHKITGRSSSFIFTRQDRNKNISLSSSSRRSLKALQPKSFALSSGVGFPSSPPAPPQQPTFLSSRLTTSGLLESPSSMTAPVTRQDPRTEVQ